MKVDVLTIKIWNVFTVLFNDRAYVLLIRENSRLLKSVTVGAYVPTSQNPSHAAFRITTPTKYGRGGGIEAYQNFEYNTSREIC